MLTSLAASGRQRATSAACAAQLGRRPRRRRVPLPAAVAGPPAAAEVGGDHEVVAGAAAAGRHRVGRAAERGHGERRVDAELGVAAEHRHVARPRPRRAGRRGRGGRATRRGRRARRAGRRASAPMAERSLTLTSTRTSRPTRVALDHRRQDRVAGRDEVGAGDGRASSPTQPVAAGLQVTASSVAERRLGGGREAGEAVDGPAHADVRVPCEPRSGRGGPAEPGEEGRSSRLHGGVEAQRAERSACAQAARTSAAPSRAVAAGIGPRRRAGCRATSRGRVRVGRA